jgi:phage-related baseplate assembly protein
VRQDAGIPPFAEESDADLRAACRAKLASISGLGPRGAYEWAVRQATRLDGTPTAITRVLVPEGSWTATINVVLASASGAPIAGDVTAASNAIEATARPSGIRVLKTPATEVPFARDVTIWARRTDGLDVEAVRAQAELAIAVGISTYPIAGIRKPGASSGALYADFIKGLCKVHPSVFDVDLSSDADLVLAETEVATWAGTVTVRIA